MNPHRVAADALNAAIRSLVPKSGALLTRNLRRRIIAETLRGMKAKGMDLTEHKSKIKLDFIDPHTPNLTIPPELLARFMH